MTDPAEADAVHAAMQKAVSLIEARVTGQPVSVDDLSADVDELCRVLVSLVVVSGSLVESFNKPSVEIIEALRLMIMKAV